MFNLQNEIAIVTGASRGIGAAIAKKLGACQCKVVVNYHQSQEKAKSVVDEIKKQGGRAFAFQADVSNPEPVNQMVDKTLKEFGEPTVLVNNVSSPINTKKFSKTQWSEYLSSFEVSVKSTLNCSQAVESMMRKAKKGKIVNIITQYSFGVPPLGLAPYVTAKHALVGLSKCMALELAPYGVQVNMVSPGLTETDFSSHLPDAFKEMIAKQTPLKRNTECEDVSNAVLFLVSDLSNYLTGVNLPVCGGNIM